MVSRRQRQVADQMRREIGDLLLRATNDPRIGFASVTEVEISADLRYARVYVSVLGSEDEHTATMNALQHATGFFRHELASRMTTKFLPELSFLLDRSIERGDRLLRLIEQVRAEDSAARPPE